MKTAIFAAAALSVFLIATSGAFAQNSDQGSPNTLHGSGDMMQDGPHASSNPNADAQGNAASSGRAVGTQQTRMNACEKKWKEAQKNGNAANTDRDTFVNSCMNSM